MKKYACRLVFAFVLFISEYVAMAAERVYSIDRSVTDALMNNQSLLYAKEEIKFAEARVKEAKSFMYPLVELCSTASRFGVQQLYPVSTDLGTVLLDPDMDSSKTHYTAKAKLKQTIYGGGRLLSTMRLANALLDKAKSQYDVIRNNIIHEVEVLFYRILEIQEKIKVFRQGLNYVEALENQFRSSVSGYDLLKLLKKKNEFASKIEKLKNQREEALLDFIRVLNIEQDLSVELEGGLDFAESEADLNKCLAWADELRPELKRTEFQEQIDALVVNLYMSERYPEVLFDTGYEFSGLNFPLKDENWNATLSFKLPIFDGWAQWSRVRQKRAQARQSRLEYVRIKDEIHLQVRDAFRNYSAKADELKRIAHLRSRIADAVKDAKKELAGGAANVSKRIDVIECQTDIEEEYLDKTVEAINSKLNLNYAVGRSLE